jgi:hypothetical protein
VNRNAIPLVVPEVTAHDGFLGRGRALQHHVCFAVFGVLLLVALRAPLTMLFSLALHDDRYSHVLVVPLISLGLIFAERKKVFRTIGFAPLQSLPFVLTACIGYWVFWRASSIFDQNDRLSVFVFALISTLFAGFMLCYGPQCFRAGLFPLSSFIPCADDPAPFGGNRSDRLDVAEGIGRRCLCTF